jgi:hypothetical protein
MLRKKESEEKKIIVVIAVANLKSKLISLDVTGVWK